MSMRSCCLGFKAFVATIRVSRRLTVKIRIFFRPFPVRQNGRNPRRRPPGLGNQILMLIRMLLHFYRVLAAPDGTAEWPDLGVSHDMSVCAPEEIPLKAAPTEDA